MKKWENPDMLVLDVNMTAHGGLSETESDGDVWEVVNGERVHHIFYTSGPSSAPSTDV